MRFEFATATRILFGPGTCAEIPALAVPLGRRVFVVADSSDRVVPLVDGLTAQGFSCIVFEVKKEPDLNSISMATRIFMESGCELVLGFGGGSAIDTGKATAALAMNPGNPLDYLEVVGTGRVIEKPSAPYIAVPTSAGTGSEVTRNAVIAIPEERVKVSLRSPYMLPRLAVIDPELTYSLPPDITASTGMDALTQCIEPFVCNAPTPLTDAFCRDGIVRAGRSLLKAYRDGRDAAAREDMSLVSLYGGMALANARLGAVHGLAGPLGGIYSVPHGAVCARLLPLVMEANLRALHDRQSDSPAINRYVEAARLLTGNPSAAAEDGVTRVRELCEGMAIRPLREYGLMSADFPVLVTQSQKASSMKGNPIMLMDEELTDILEKAM
jgi:alcohol dehydrogenase class IV